MNGGLKVQLVSKGVESCSNSGYGRLGVIAAATFVVYLVFGLFYATQNADRLKGAADLRLKNEQYLQAFGTWDTDFEGDEAFYNRTAMQVIRTGAPRDRKGALALHAPLYSYFLGACYAVGGVNRFSVAVPQSAFAALLAWFLGLTARRLNPQLAPQVMWWAGGLILTNLVLAKSAALILPTLPLLFWVSLVLYLATGPLRAGSVLGIVVATVLAIFTQAAFFVAASAIALWLAWQFVRQKRPLLAFGCVGILLGIGVHLSLAAIAARAGATAWENKSMILWEANNPYYESMTPFSLWGRRPLNPWSDWRPSPQEQQRFDEYFKRGETESRNPGLLWIRENPAQYAKLCWIRFYTSLGPFTGQMSARNRLISAFYWLLIFPAGLYGLWRVRRTAFAGLGVLVFLALTAFDVLIITEWQLRYRLPWVLMLTVCAAAVYAGLFQARRAPQQAHNAAADPRQTNR